MKENWPRQLSENLGTEWIKQPLQTNHKSTTHCSKQTLMHVKTTCTVLKHQTPNAHTHTHKTQNKRIPARN